MLLDNECIDEYCYNDFVNQFGNSSFTIDQKGNEGLGNCPYSCTSTVNGLVYWGGKQYTNSFGFSVNPCSY